jgi:hypothetical protein
LTNPGAWGNRNLGMVWRNRVITNMFFSLSSLRVMVLMHERYRVHGAYDFLENESDRRAEATERGDWRIEFADAGEWHG